MDAPGLPSTQSMTAKMGKDCSHRSGLYWRRYALLSLMESADGVLITSAHSECAGFVAGLARHGLTYLAIMS